MSSRLTKSSHGKPPKKAIKPAGPRGAAIYGDHVTRMRIANLLTICGPSTSLDIIGMTPQPPDVTARLAVAPSSVRFIPSETHFQSPLFDRTMPDPGAEPGSLRQTKRHLRATSLPLRTWGGIAAASEPTWKDFKDARSRKIAQTLTRRRLRSAGKNITKKPQ